MSQCPAGHQSTASDYCDMCGIRMDAVAVPPGTHERFVAQVAQQTAEPASPCPRCGLPGLGRFCESCGYAAGSTADTAAPAASTTPKTWTATVAASRSYYDDVMSLCAPGAAEVRFPDAYPQRTFWLRGAQMRIGRRSASREVSPEIDLTGPPTDPGISRLHAILIAQPDGSWAVVDPGSENGTTVNGAEITPNEVVQLHEGDCVCIGAWTAITIVAP